MSEENKDITSNGGQPEVEKETVDTDEQKKTAEDTPENNGWETVEEEKAPEETAEEKTVAANV